MGKIKGEIERWIYCKTREKGIAKDAIKVEGKVLPKITCLLSVGDMIDMGLMGKQRMTVLVVTSL